MQVVEEGLEILIMEEMVDLVVVVLVAIVQA
jgi:hypothetical protein